MKKYTLFGVLGVALTIVAVLTVLTAATPSKPTRYSWKAEILSTSENLEYGVYNDSDEFANVMVFVREYSGPAGYKEYAPVFWLEVLNPAEIGLKNVSIIDGGYDFHNISCGFPDAAGGFPSCWQSFLSGLHPKDGYHRASFMHEGKRFETKGEADYNNMPIAGLPMVMRLHFLTQGQKVTGSSDQANLTGFHQIDGQAQGEADDGTGANQPRL